MAASWCKMRFLYRELGVKIRHCNWVSARFGAAFLHRKATNICVIHKKHVSSERGPLQKKDCSTPMSQVFNPVAVEAQWYDWWLQQRYFSPSQNSDNSGQTFCVLLPPPNVTGDLHLGHALTGSVQDALVRWHRMKGHHTLWIPGTDHAGIATHAVVEKRLLKETGKSRHDVGREKFVQAIWEWKTKHGNKISEQMRILGLSLDWNREYFTMDKRLGKSVTEAFCRLYEKGLIYRDKRLVHWSSALQSTLSDVEVDWLRVEGSTKLRVPGEVEEVEVGVLDRFGYPILDSEDWLIVSTTRLETMLGDSAVAVHPDDPRYSHLIGHRVKHPIIEGRTLPIIADSFVDMTFGTGAVKITPGHDHNDYELGLRHDLPIYEVLNDDGTMSDSVPLVAGMSRFQARKKLREGLCLLGYYCGQRDLNSVLPICSRSGDIVEPRLKQQWFLDCTSMAERALQAAETGELNLIPAYNQRIWHEFLSNSKDWCLSRQLWWGHRIPVYRYQATGEMLCARSLEEAQEKLSEKYPNHNGKFDLIQDEDVLDTWFSSALLPFSALGWPQQTVDLNKFFPQNLLETGQDILFFWVARMVMMSLELTDKLPFKTVLLHGLLRDAHGRKMSKSLGNVIDPLDVVNGISLQDLQSRLEQSNLDAKEIELAKAGQAKDFPEGIVRCGADALRLTLLSYNVKNVEINFSVEHLESKRRFCNKIWQSFRFIFSKLDEQDGFLNKDFQLSGKEDGTDLWLLSRLSHMVRSCDSAFDSYDLHLAVEALDYFWYHELCDIYLEAVKPVFLSPDSNRQAVVKQVLIHCADVFLRANAPFMPYLSEELYQRLPLEGKADSVCVAEYPTIDKCPWQNTEVEQSMNVINEMVHQILKLRKEFNIMGSRSKVYIETDTPAMRESIEKHHTALLALSRSGEVTMLNQGEATPDNCCCVRFSEDVKLYVEFTDDEELATRLSRLEERETQLFAKVDKLQEKLTALEAKRKGDSQQGVKVKEKILKAREELTRMADLKASLTTTKGR